MDRKRSLDASRVGFIRQPQNKNDISKIFILYKLKYENI